MTRTVIEIAVSSCFVSLNRESWPLLVLITVRRLLTRGRASHLCLNWNAIRGIRTRTSRLSRRYDCVCLFCMSAKIEIKLSSNTAKALTVMPLPLDISFILTHVSLSKIIGRPALSSVTA